MKINGSGESEKTNPIRTQFKPNQTQSPSAIRNTQYEIRDTNPNKACPERSRMGQFQNVERLLALEQIAAIMLEFIDHEL